MKADGSLHLPLRPVFAITPAQPEDEPRLVALGQAEDMGALEGFDTTLVARSAEGAVAGFCRIRVYGGRPHVNPLVTAPAFRRQGVGAQLMREAAATWGELYFVARGNAVPFYNAIGSTPVPWEEIAPEVAGDCDGCPLLAGCHPQPMAYRP
ncbi:MAG: GNAT family N-acetyltransferase [Coriobacteriales bacterium]